jgi:hypothetical protein
MELESGPLKPLCACGDRAVTTLGKIPMCNGCLGAALRREGDEAEELLEKMDRGEIPAPPAVRYRGPAQ